VLALMTDGPEIPDARHVTDDKRSDYDRHEHSNIYYTARRKNYEEEEDQDDKLPGKSGLILYSTAGSARYEMIGAPRDIHQVSYPAAAAFHAFPRCFPFTSLPLFLFPLYPISQKGFALLGTRKRRRQFLLCPHAKTHGKGFFGCKERI
jgi:hypothetical protein